jgi:hypothetical protein
MSNALLVAINSCLAGVGISPVDSVDDTDLDAAQASSTISRVTSELLGRGWWFNTEIAWKSAPEPISGHIPLSNDTMNIIPTGNSNLQKLVMRQGKIYDLVLHTFNLVDSVYSDGFIHYSTVVLLPFEDLPPIVREAVTARARRIFAQDSEVDANRWNFQIRDDEKALDMVLVEESRNHKGNYFRDHPSAQGNIALIGGSNSGVATSIFRGKRYE